MALKSKKGRRHQPSGEKVGWKSRPSEISGYHRTFFVNSEEGDFIRVDYNIKDKKVRIYIEDHEEGGAPYYAVISNGQITAEKNSKTGVSTKLFEKFKKRASVLSTLPNHEVIRLINKNYGIIEQDERSRKNKSIKAKELEETRRRYFKPEYYAQAGDQPYDRPVKRVGLIDIIDAVVGIALCIGIYLLWKKFFYVGIASAFFGIVLGIIDIFIRGREPIFTKVLFFIVVGFTSYIYDYFFL